MILGQLLYRVSLFYPIVPRLGMFWAIISCWLSSPKPQRLII